MAEIKKSNTFNVKWPSEFTTGVLVAKDDKSLCALGLHGWALCIIAPTLPRNFGKAMVAIGKKLDITPTAENIEEYAKGKGYLKP